MLSQNSSRRLFSKWLHTRLAQVPANKTVALLVDHSEVKNGELSCLEHLHGSEHFRQDLSLNKSAWFYTNDAQMRRCLLI